MVKRAPNLFASSRWMWIGLAAVLLGLGLAIRLYDLRDLPLDFHPTRQLLSHLKSRGMFYQANPTVPEWQRRMAVQQWRTKAEVEPEVFERLVALTYRLTGVETWVARLYASLFWVIGGVFLLLVTREMVSPDAAIIALGYFLFFPYAVIASRSFQPDVPMIMLLLAFWWIFHRWTRSETWGWAILAGLVGGLAIYVKFVAAFFVLGAAIGMGVGTFGRQLFRKRQAFLMALVGILPTISYLYYGLVAQGFLGRQFQGRFIPSLLLNPGNYLQWADMANLAAGGLAIAFGLLGLLIVRGVVVRSFLWGLWIAYAAFGLFFDYHIATHDYYHLPLIAIAAVSLAPVAEAVMQHLRGITTGRGPRIAAYAILLYALFAGAWAARGALSAVDFRPQAGMWRQIGETLKHGPNVVALTQDYGSRLAYWGWQNSIIWPNSADADYREARGGSIEFEELFGNMTHGNTYFLVTDFDELIRQPLLQERLLEFPVFAEGAGYTIYDLEHRGGS